MARSKKFNHRRCCARKKKQCKNTAIRTAVMMAAKYGYAFEAYQCHWCGQWHVGRVKV